MDRHVISTDKAPAAVGPYSQVRRRHPRRDQMKTFHLSCSPQGIKTGNTVYVSGCIGLVPGTKDFAGADVEAQTEQVMKNMGAILEAAGSSYDKVTQC